MLGMQSTTLYTNPHRGRVLLALIAVVATVVAGLGAAAQAAGPGHDRIVSAVPSAQTPAANNGAVFTFAQVGGTMFAGGTFTSVSAPGGAAQARSYLIGFSPTTGALSTTFKPVLNGAVQNLQPGPTAGTVYAAGNFTTVNGVGASHLVLLDTTTGKALTTFKAAATNGVVNSLARSGNRLFVGGNFTKAGGVTHGGLATLNASTGALDPFMNVQLSVRHNDSGAGAQGPVGTKDLTVNDQGDRLAVDRQLQEGRRPRPRPGDDGQRRRASAVVTPDWGTTRYTPPASASPTTPTSATSPSRPTAGYFVVTATGGHNGGTLCDTAARFETYATGTSQSAHLDQLHRR